MKRVAIVGGGLAGLSAAFDLARGGIAFDLFEESGRLGGMVRSSVRDGFLIEHGADSWIANKPWLEELARDLGMEDEIVASPVMSPSPSTSILRDGKLIPLPAGLSLFVPNDLDAVDESPLFSDETKRRFYRELESPPQPLAEDADESVARFVERHFGREVVDILAAPLLAGVYGGDANALSARAVIPGMVANEARYGSLIAGAQKARSPNPPREGIFCSLRWGMGSLVERLASTLPRDSLHLDAAVTGVVAEDEGYSIKTEAAVCSSHPSPSLRSGSGWGTLDNRPVRPEKELRSGYSHVILALPVPTTAQVLGLELPKIDYSSAATVALAYDFVPRLPTGFGFLVASGEPCAVMAATFVQQKWPERVPAGKTLIRAFVADAKLLALEDGVLAEAAQKALAKVLGIAADPLFAVVDRWPHSMPQYKVGHLTRVEQIRATVAERHGCRVLLAGNSFQGVGMPDAVYSGRDAARIILQN